MTHCIPASPRSRWLWLTGALALAVTPASSEIVCPRGDSCTATARASGRLYEPRAGHAPVIRSFDLSFVGRDRPVHRLELGAVGDSFRYALEDRDGEDAIAARVEFYEWGSALDQFRSTYAIPGGSAYATFHTVAARGCRGSCTIEIPRPPEGRGTWDGDFFFALTGFSFAYQGERARYLREVSIWPNGDGGVDTVFGNTSGNHPYDVELGYALVPRSRPTPDPSPTRPMRSLRTVISTNTSVAGSPPYPLFRGGGTIPIVDPDDGWIRLRYLGGFKARYRGGDHHLKRLAIDLHHAPASLYLEDNDGRERVLFSIFWHAAQTQFN